MRFIIIGVLLSMFSASVLAMPVLEEPELIFTNRLNPLSIFNPPKEPELVFTKPFDTTLRLKHYEDGRKAKMYWYAINALDVYTTYNGLRANENLYEANPALPDRPSLSQLVLHKAVMFSLYNRYFKFTQSDYQHLNVVLTAVVINNHSLYN
jgi:hypothetical protein